MMKKFLTSTSRFLGLSAASAHTCCLAPFCFHATSHFSTKPNPDHPSKPKLHFPFFSRLQDLLVELLVEKSKVGVEEIEWSKAQQIVISEDLVATAKQQLQFLAAVDRNRWLYKGPALQRSIYRYNACWLPLLAKNAESQISKGPLVVPLDCEWVWHCHRLNPVRYISDCKKFYGRILDNCNVLSSIEGTSGRETEKIWGRLYPDEPYSFDPDTSCWDKTLDNAADAEKHTTYDLVLAIERQSPFFYQVSRPHMKNDLFLEAVVARYKGFLHLINKNREHMLKRFCVPTYDIDLIWHSHQLHPVSYCKDMVKLIGKVLKHDDTDSDRTKGQKLDVGFSETTSQWEQIFGSRYWRSGSMYRGAAPSPLITIPFVSKSMTNKIVSTDVQQQIISLPELKSVELQKNGTGRNVSGM
ncbi:glycine-rich domain-containing protein 1-like isoform X3 [Daucus carota subsp. sativus]|uniref:glycine-rich domain-containing protein 1-like isoform X3 n=1 Tax=Daucus carota subsp. sativus TaxID=79200 RepID=UPI003082B3E6